MPLKQEWYGLTPGWSVILERRLEGQNNQAWGAKAVSKQCVFSRSPKTSASNCEAPMIDNINASKAPDPVGLYPHAKRVGDLLFLSGIGPRQKGSAKIPGVELVQACNIQSYDFVTQCHSVFRNVRHVLEAPGSSWDKLVDITVFLTNMKEDFAVF